MGQNKTNIGRFEVLDGWRGICALVIALFHFQVRSHLTAANFLENCFLFVDFFFVLSGFVIAANYQQRLAQGFSAGQFMLLRFGRIYPLHLFTFACFILAEVIKLALQSYLPFENAAFNAPLHAPQTLFAQLFLLQSFNFNQFLTWNVPSWSVAVEFWAYLLFAQAVIYGGRYFNFIMVATVAAGMTIIWLFCPYFMNATYDFGMYRCLAGFCSGVICWEIWRRYLHQIKLSVVVASLLEILVTLNVIFFIKRAAWTEFSICAPIIFAFAVLVFAVEGGIISRLLRKGPFQLLGALSYSVYMMHYFIEEQIENAVVMANKLKLFAFNTYDSAVTPPAKLLEPSLWHGDLWTVIMVCFLLPIAYLTYNHIEIPSRNWFRKFAETQSQAQLVRP